MICSCTSTITSPAPLVSLLQASSKHKDLFGANRLHAHILKAGLLGNDHVVSALIHAYATCGALEEAAEIFFTLPARTLIAWTALIAGYARFGPYRRALDCVRSMRCIDAFSPDTFTFVCALKACGNLQDLEMGSKFHAEIIEEGRLGGHVFVGNALVDMYAKCGALDKALETFDELPLRDLSSWNVMISGYAQNTHVYDGDDDSNSYGNEWALTCFYRMQLEGFVADFITIVAILKACGHSGNIRRGQEIHARFFKVEQHISASNTLVDMYAKCGLLPEAQRIFDDLPLRDIISWNVLIAAYAQCGYGKEALHLFERMHCEGFSPDAVTLISALKACGIVGAVEKGREIQAEIVKEGWIQKHDLVGNALVDMYSKCGSIEEAQKVFNELPFWNVGSWNTLISGYGQHDHAEKALQCFEMMQTAAISPDTVTFVCILKICGKVGALQKGEKVHAKIVLEGLLQHILIGHGLVDMYAKCGAMTEAQEMFNKLAPQNVMSWNSLLSGYAQLGNDGSVFECFNKMTTVVEPDFVTFLIVLYACSHSGLLLLGQICFNSMIADYGIIPTLQHYNCIIDLFARADHFQQAMEIIDEMPFCANLIAWHAVLSGCRKRDNENLGRLAYEHAVQLDGVDRASHLILRKYIYKCRNLCVQC